MSRPWPSSLAPFPCLDGSCKPPELCSHCCLRSATLPALAKEDDSVDTFPQYASSTSLEYPSVSTLHRARSTTMPTLFQQAYTNPCHPYAQAPATYAGNLTLMENFISEPITSQPYNVVYSFSPLPAKSQAGTSTLAATFKQDNSSPAHITKRSALLHSRSSHPTGKKPRAT